MNANLMDMTRDFLNPGVSKKIASQLGETPEATHKGLSSAVPAVMAGFVRQATSDPSGTSITRMLAEGPGGGEKFDDASALIGKGQSMLGNLFGDRLPSAVDHVAHSSALSQKSAGKILALAAPVVGAVIGREASSRKLGPAGIATMLAEQKGAVASALGAGGLASIFGGGAEMGTMERMRQRMVTPEGKPAGKRVGMPLVLLGVLAVLALLMLLGRRKAPIGTTMPGASKEVPRAEAPQPPEVKPPAPPMGGGPSAAVSELNQFFADTTEPTPKRIALDGVNFERDSETLTPAAARSLDGVAITLKAHPTAQVRIEGFTDDSGNADYNKMLSANRANAVKDGLVRRGVDENRITIASHGAEHPVAPNDTEEGRAQNRRIDIVVTSR